MKKSSILIAILLIVITISTGCNNTEAKTEQVSSNASKESEPKTFDEVYLADGLENAVYYLNDNFNSFSDESKASYMKNLAQEIYDRSLLYSEFINLEPKEGPAPIVIEHVDWLYEGIYDSKTNTIYAGSISESAKLAALKIKKDDFFVLCKKYYAMDGSIEDMGFDIIVKKEIYDILMDRYSEYITDQENYFKYVKTYTDVLNNSDDKFESQETYPVVLVEESEKIEMLRNEWKTEIVLPVVVEEKTPNTKNPDKKVSDKRVLKNYSGPGLENLQAVDVDAELGGETDNVAIFGTIYDVQVGKIRLFTEGNYESIKDYDELSDTVIQISNSATNDQANQYAVYVKFYDEDLNIYTMYFEPEDAKGSFEENSEVVLKEGTPSNALYDTDESTIITDIKGSDDDFKVFFLIDDVEQYVKDKSYLQNLYLDVDSEWADYDGIITTTVIPMWVSSNMYDIKVKKLNMGEEQSTYEPYLKNIKAGSFIKWSGYFEGDMQSYEIHFALEDGTKKIITIANDESDNSISTKGLALSISN